MKSKTNTNDNFYITAFHLSKKLFEHTRSICRIFVSASVVGELAAAYLKIGKNKIKHRSGNIKIGRQNLFE